MPANDNEPEPVFFYRCVFFMADSPTLDWSEPFNTPEEAFTLGDLDDRGFDFTVEVIRSDDNANTL
jgi:hypothetical protein